jgi:hypothetical protein
MIQCLLEVLDLALVLFSFFARGEGAQILSLSGPGVGVA